MKGLPNELLLLVLFGAIMLFNFVMQRAARRRQAEAAQHAPPQEIDEEAEPPAPVPLAAPVPARPPGPPVKRTAATVGPKRRFARQTLFGTRRDRQDAFVVATILGHCRADEPHEVR